MSPSTISIFSYTPTSSHRDHSCPKFFFFLWLLDGTLACNYNFFFLRTIFSSTDLLHCHFIACLDWWYVRAHDCTSDEKCVYSASCSMAFSTTSLILPRVQNSRPCAPSSYYHCIFYFCIALGAFLYGGERGNRNHNIIIITHTLNQKRPSFGVGWPVHRRNILARADFDLISFQ